MILAYQSEGITVNKQITENKMAETVQNCDDCIGSARILQNIVHT